MFPVQSVTYVSGLYHHDPVPAYVERTFRKYLECGDFAHGFVHVQCASCGPGEHDLAVA